MKIGESSNHISNFCGAASEEEKDVTTSPSGELVRGSASALPFLKDWESSSESAKE
jgi:hypothetical protein